MATEVVVGRVEEFDEFDRKLIFVDGVKVGVFRVDDGYVAYENRCMHQGGPVCEGRVFGKVEPVLEPDKHVIREKFSDTVKHLVCPWHGWEYDLRTGVAAGDGRFRLNRFEVVERDGTVYVLVDRPLAAAQPAAGVGGSG